MAQDSKKYDNLSKTKKNYDYFEGHTCCVPGNTISDYEITCSRLRLFVLNLTTAQMSDTRARKHYMSHAEFCDEKYRQYKYYPYSIHPYSKFRVWFEMFYLVVLVLITFIMAVHYSAPNPNENGYLKFILLFTDIIYLFNIFTNLFTGYLEGYSYKTVIFDWKKILVKYSGSWLILDIISIASIVPSIIVTDVKNLELMLVSMRFLRVPKHYFYIKNLLELTTQNEIIQQIFAEVTFFLVFYLLWNIYFQFATEYFFEDSFTPTTPRNCSWITIGKLWDQSWDVRFVYSLDRAVGMLRGNANLNLLGEEGCFEIYFMVAWFISKILVLHCTFKYIIAVLGSESARSDYFIMTQQVEMYLNQRKFPPRIKKKILKFYSIRFFNHFFVEHCLLTCVTGQLREDIIMHTGRQLVRNVAFLKQLPRSLLLQISIKLRIVIFIAGDIILKINTIGECLYLIHKGTVAIYSQSGKEVCHLDDGDFFGEIALIMQHRLRTASAVAVTNCELFQLDREDFERSVASYPTVYEDIKKVATTRLERTTVMDEHHKSEMIMKTRKRADSVNYEL